MKNAVPQMRTGRRKALSTICLIHTLPTTNKGKGMFYIAQYHLSLSCSWPGSWICQRPGRVLATAAVKNCVRLCFVAITAPRLNAKSQPQWTAPRLNAKSQPQWTAPRSNAMSQPQWTTPRSNAKSHPPWTTPCSNAKSQQPLEVKAWFIICNPSRYIMPWK